jgi:serine/threonine protein kinase
VVHRRLGEGGMGVVFKAFDGQRTSSSRSRRSSGSTRRDLRTEVGFRALADVVHPRLVRLHDLIVQNGLCFFTMEKIDGVPFLEHVRGERAARTRRHRRLPRLERRRI